MDTSTEIQIEKIQKNNKDDIIKSVTDFKRAVEITRDVRFQANIRLSQRQRTSSYVVSFLSLYVLSLSLIPNILKLEHFQTQILLASSVILSVFIIFTSLIDGAQNFYHQGEILHQCARKIATVHHKIKNINTSEDDNKIRISLEELQKEYTKALDECPVNHGNADFVAQQARKPHLFNQQYENSFPVLRVQRKKLYAFILFHSWMAPHVVVFCTISWVVYYFIFRQAEFVAP